MISSEKRWEAAVTNVYLAHNRLLQLRREFVIIQLKHLLEVMSLKNDDSLMSVVEVTDSVVKNFSRSKLSNVEAVNCLDWQVCYFELKRRSTLRRHNMRPDLSGIISRLESC